MGRLDRRVALVTGGGSGIGRGVALAFAAEGAQVAVNHPPGAAEQRLAEATCEDMARHGGTAMSVVAAMEARVRETLGPIDILVNCAGIASSATVEALDLEAWDRVIAVHLRGTFLCTRSVLPGMYERNRGTIINTASQLAYKGAPGFSHYTAAKGGILAFTRSLALEVGPRNVSVNAVAPGATRTPMLDQVPEETLDAIRAGIPKGRLAEVADIVPAYLFLASDEARHFVGQCLSPNGGDVFL